jgi:PKD repeat protein
VIRPRRGGRDLRSVVRFRWAGVILVVAVAFGLLLSSVAFSSLRPGAAPEVRSDVNRPPVSSFASATPRTSLVPTSPETQSYPAVGAPSWHNITVPKVGGAPPATFWGDLAYDAADHETVAFGGCGTVQCPENLTWAFANGTWQNITNRFDAPPARAGAMMTYDPNMQGVLLFGGVGTAGYRADTWLFRGGEWTNISYVSPAPPGRAFAGLAFDPAPEENGSVLFGGYSATLGDLNDTWVWEAWSGWVHLNISVRPPAADAVAMAYDPVDSMMILYGAGFTSSTWELYSGQWWNASISAPPYRTGAAMIYDPAQGSDILFGGANGSLLLNDVWSFVHGAWSSLSFGSGPNGRALTGLTLDPSGSIPFLYAGTGGATYRNDTWVYSTTPSVTIAAAPGTTEVTIPVTFTATVNSGTPPYVATFHFGDSVATVVSGNGPTLTVSHAYSSTGSFIPSVNVTDSAGLVASASSLTAIVVTAGPTIVASASPTVVDIGAPVAFSASATVPGTPPITYSWKFGDGGTSTAGASVTYAYSTAGTYRASVTGTDSGGLTSTANLTILVNSPPALSVGVNRSTTTVGYPVTFYANLSGGTSPYRYSWNFGDGNRSTFPTPTHIFGTAGNFTVVVWTNDSFSASDHQSIRVAVQAAIHRPSPPPATNNSTTTTITNEVMPSWFYPGVGAVAAVGAVGAGLLLWRGRSAKS